MIVPLYRLYLLRGLYLLIAVGEGLVQWPRIIHHPLTWTFWNGVSTSMLVALTLVCFLGLRYPLQMLPLLIFEFAWKLTWVLVIALPLWAAHRVDADTAESIFPIGMGVILCPLVIPWTYVFANYVKKPGDRWK